MMQGIDYIGSNYVYYIDTMDPKIQATSTSADYSNRIAWF